MKNNLLACPFCGSRKITPYDELSQSDDRTLWKLYCLGCRAAGPIRYSYEDAEIAWNARNQCGHEKIVDVSYGYDGYVCTLCRTFFPARYFPNTSTDACKEEKVMIMDKVRKEKG